jgi:hypothetical protein
VNFEFFEQSVRRPHFQLGHYPRKKKKKINSMTLIFNIAPPPAENPVMTSPKTGSMARLDTMANSDSLHEPRGLDATYPASGAQHPALGKEKHHS